MENKDKRLFGLTRLAVDNGTSVILLTCMIFFFGIMAYISMPKEAYPEIIQPQVFVNTIYFGNSAEDIESLITRPIEKEIQQVTGLKKVTSTSQQDYSIIIAEFRSDVDINDALSKVKDAVDKADSELPTDLDQDPIVDDFRFSELPIMTVNLSGDIPHDQLRKYAEYLEDEIEDLKEISDVALKGSQEKEIKIEVDLQQMHARQISFQDIEQAIASENVTMSAGEILGNNFRRALRVIGEFETPEELKNVIVKSEDLKPVYLRDIADVLFDYKEATSIARSNGLPVISLDVVKRSGENLLHSADKIDEIIKHAEEHVFSDAITVQKFNDLSIATRTQVKDLENSIISGVILVVLVLLFFLGLRNALFVGVAIPLSMLMGIMVLNLAGLTMNMVVLFSLILALGLLVDNAIVVVENIYRHVQEGYSLSQAAKLGASEVAAPIIASTATTLAAFLPLAFWPGIMGGFMRYLPITLITVLISSLVMALVINPVLTSNWMTVNEDETVYTSKKKRFKLVRNLIIFLVLGIIGAVLKIDALRNIMGFIILISLLNSLLLTPGANAFQKSFLPWLENLYNRFIAIALKYAGLIFGGTCLMLVLSIGLLILKSPKSEFFPEADPLYVNAFIEMPLGTDIQATNKIAEDIEDKIIDVVKPYGDVVEAVLTQIGENTSDPAQPPEGGSSPHKARITTSFVPAQDRDGVSTFEIMRKIRNVVGEYPGVEITIDKNAEGPPVGKAINIEIIGEDISELTIQADRLKSFINEQGIAGIEELKSDVKLGKPELLVHVDREAARRYGLSTFQIAGSIRTALFGKEISKYKLGEDDYDIYVRLADKYRYEVSNLMSQKVTFRSPSNGQIIQVPISAVATTEYSNTYNAIKRKDLDRQATVFSNVIRGYNKDEVVNQIKAAMPEFDLPDGYRFEFTGEQQQQSEDMGFLMTAFMVAIFAIFLIMVAQFNSILSPFIIIISVLFSLIGVFLGYVVTGSNIVVIMTGVGIISLAGVVVNNAIVLIDFINIVLKDRMKTLGLSSIFELPKHEAIDCVKEAGAKRLRPVLLTAITTVLGLIPLAIGLNINFATLVTDLDPQYFIGGDNVAFWGPMAWTVIYGLVFATFLTLVVVPSMYWLAFRMKKYFFKKPKEALV